MKAVVLLSGGLDSTVSLAMAKEKGRECLALSFNYGQRHLVELEYAKKIASHYHVAHKIIIIDRSSFDHSSLVTAADVPKNRTEKEISESGVPNTYVPARNTLFLAYAAAQAEIFGASEIYAGPNLLDRKPYPDCRPEFYTAFQQVLNLATKQAIEGNAPRLITPLIDLTKKEIVAEAKRLQVPIESTFSCYDPSPKGTPCTACDACILRSQALYFTQAFSEEEEKKAEEEKLKVEEQIAYPSYERYVEARDL